MYLKEITASGFKSFADKLSIDLNGKTTCIVGPNGSGKSNIVDAVKWVLGEQSVKTLRGDGSMTDVIFSGSKNRNPLNVASVSLIFDNSDNYLKIPYNEVSIKRRVYRSGENEYYLNGEKCRLKDIINLLMDSGIGRDSFNIISQGEVQRILSNSSLDRRVIFEEAAGVLKYKKRKEEALRKLERTDDNLNRVNDIITELENQVNPLREQSIKAKEYLENKEGLDKYEVALITNDIEEINYEYQKNKTKIEELNKEIISSTTTNTTTDIKLIKLKENLEKKENYLLELNNKLLKLTTEAEQINTKKHLLSERSKYDSNSDKVKTNIINLTNEKLELETKLEIFEKEIGSIKEEYNSIKEKQNNIEKDIKEVNNKKEYLIKEYNCLQKEKYEYETKIEVLKNNIENGSSLSYSVKNVLNNPKLHGIHDIIGNLIESDESLTKTLEVALSSSKQFIVVDNEQNAKDAIKYLKENNGGRATFFPLTTIKPKDIDYNTLNIAKSIKGYIGVLSDLIKFDKKYENIILNQLGNIIVCNNIDDANEISRKIFNKYRVITLDGDIIHVGGSLTGGSLKLQKSIISLKQELKSCENNYKDIKEKISNINNSLEQEEEKRKEIESKLYINKNKEVEKSEKIKTKNEVLSLNKYHLDEITTELSNLNNVVNNSAIKEEEKLLNEYYSKVKEKEETLLQIKKESKNEETIKNEILEIEAQNKITNSSLRKQEQELKELEIKVSKMDVKLDSYLNVLSEEYSLTFEKAKETYILDIDAEEARRKVNVYKSNIKRLGMVNLGAIDEYERVNTRYTFLTSQRDDLLNAKDTLFEIISEMDEVMKQEFTSTFKLIEVEFKKVFKELFGGGNAELKLTNPYDILETGIDIIASPPGKKLTTISLLSGGEKTLTAISLLFAILNVRTVPFCLFDEVEAALDEANVDRFGHYLKHYEGKTQFLIITHKKKTMEYAETLYGITMQEMGVSKLVSVSLKDKE